MISFTKLHNLRKNSISGNLFCYRFTLRWQKWCNASISSTDLFYLVNRNLMWFLISSPVKLSHYLIRYVSALNSKNVSTSQTTTIRWPGCNTFPWRGKKSSNSSYPSSQIKKTNQNNGPPCSNRILWFSSCFQNLILMITFENSSRHHLPSNCNMQDKWPSRMSPLSLIALSPSFKISSSR